ncbi:hypothetical protein HYH02_004549 [Chlamydomonas schloesseri]|uniref:Peptidase S8/S53 domain-containing protein n=1 Tax=Chlamydomonas schloesseri TaxID=2026947 RepID=A0A836B8A5_9CHLO|nr:hypothetical protein HYH02_004549 [Chlamydomonas schloesseri]|eukprot:KAG2450711.1 hypothetical protein HYH02_004549 [Chlamydomonas schloesseri]
MSANGGSGPHDSGLHIASPAPAIQPPPPPVSNVAYVRRRAGSPGILEDSMPGTSDGLTVGILNPLFKGSGRAIDLHSLPGFGDEYSAPVNSPMPQPAARTNASGTGSHSSPLNPHQARRQSNDGGGSSAGPPPGLTPITAAALFSAGSGSSGATCSPYLAVPPSRMSPSGRWANGVGGGGAAFVAATASPAATPMGSIQVADTYSPDHSQQLSRYDSAGSRLSAGSGSGGAYGRMATGGSAGLNGAAAVSAMASPRLEPSSSITAIATITTKQRGNRLSAATTSPAAATPAAAAAAVGGASAAAAGAGAGKSVAFSDAGRAVGATAAAASPASPEPALKSVPAPLVVHGTAAASQKPAAAAPADPVKAEKVAAAAAAAAGLSTSKKTKKKYMKAAEDEAALKVDPEAAKREAAAEAKEQMKAKRRKRYTNLMCCCCCILFAGIIATVIAVPICVINGCPPKKADTNVVTPEEGLFSLRLLARMEDVEKKVSDLVPPLLRDYVNVTRLQESAVEFLDFGDLAVLREVRDSLLTKYKDQLTFLIPDFPMRFEPDLADAARAGLSQLGAAVTAAASNSLGGVSIGSATASNTANLLASYANGSMSLTELSSLLPDSTKQTLQDLAAQIAAAADSVPGTNGTPLDGASLLNAALSGSTGSLLSTLRQTLTSAAGGGSTGGSSATDLLAEHSSLVSAAAAGAAKDLTGLLGGGGTVSGGSTAAGADPNVQWYLKKAEVANAWSLTEGAPDVIVAVVDTGFDIDHPDLKPNLWVNPGEVSGDGIDNDGNGYIDDINGFDFAGSGDACQGDWRARVSPPPPPSPPPPSPPPPSPPPPSRRSPPPARKTASQRAQASALTAPTARATYATQLRPMCSPDANVRPESGDSGHGTHVAGIVAAVRNRVAAVAGAAPRVKVMVLKVFDASGRVYASHVVAAYAYAQRMGAHIVSCSFGPDTPNLQPQPYEVAEMAAQESLYSSAVSPLEAKGVLLVAAAGNELTDLNALASVKSNYLPCTLPNANVMCITGSNPLDRVITGMAGNMPVGVNYGTAVVDMAAPGQDIYNTFPVSLGSYGNKTGSSMATPLVAGVAALVASVVGAVGPLAASPNYFQASRVKSLMLETADKLPGLPVIGGRRLNAQRAVEAAYAATGGSYLLTPSSEFYTANAGSASLLTTGLAEQYFMAAAPQAAGTPTTLDTIAVPAAPFDVSMRVPVNNTPVTRLLRYKYTPATANISAPGGGASGVLLLRLVGLARFSVSGVWGLQLSGAMAPASVRIMIGQRLLNLTTIGATASLMVPTAGLYDFEMLVLAPSGPVELRWASPAAPGVYGAPDPGLLVVASYSPAVHPRFAPNVTFSGVSAAPGWQVMWDYNTRDDGAAPAAQLPPAFLTTFSTGLAPLSGAPYVPLRNSMLTGADLFRVAGSFGAAATTATQATLAGANPPPGLAAPDFTTTAAYGVAVAQFIPPSSGQMQFQVTCSSCLLFVQGVLVADAAQQQPIGSASTSGSPGLLTVQSGCMSLSSALTSSSSVYTLELRFVVGDANRGVLGVSWSPCSPAGSPTGQWGGLAGMLTSSVMWAPPAAGTAFNQSALRCDLWRSRGAADAGVVPSPRLVTPLASFTLPRAGSRNQNCTLWSSNPNCTAVALATALDVVPTLVSGTGSYHVRCWAFWNGTFKAGAFSVRSATITSSPAAVANVFLGNQQVFRSTAPIAAPFVNFNRQSLAPRVNAIAPYLQLLAFEYSDVSPTAVMGLLDGTEVFAVRETLLIDRRMVVPAGLSS